MSFDYSYEDGVYKINGWSIPKDKEKYNNKNQYCIKDQNNNVVFASTTNLGIVYWLIHKLKQDNPTKEITINFNGWDLARQKIAFERSDSKQWGDQHDQKRLIMPALIPKGVTVCAHKVKVSSEKNLQGTGSVDYLFAAQTEDCSGQVKRDTFLVDTSNSIGD